MRKRMPAPAVLVLTAILGLAGCQQEPEGYHYLIAKRSQVIAPVTVTLSLIRRFEKEKWCEAQLESLEKDEFTVRCEYESEEYRPMFEGKAVGKWYAIQRVGPFQPSVVMYDFEPELPEEVALMQLRESAPHILKFAAVHKAPAEVQIVSPAGEIQKV